VKALPLRRTPAEEWLAAQHEAGHAVVSYLVGRAFAFVTIRALITESGGMVALRPCTPIALQSGAERAASLTRLQHQLRISDAEVRLMDEGARLRREREARDGRCWRGGPRRTLFVYLAGPLAQRRAAKRRRMTRDRSVWGSRDYEVAVGIVSDRYHASGRDPARRRRQQLQRVRYLVAAERKVAAILERPSVRRAVDELADALLRDGTVSARLAKRIIRRGLRGDPRRYPLA